MTCFSIFSVAFAGISAKFGIAGSLRSVIDRDDLTPLYSKAPGIALYS